MRSAPAAYAAWIALGALVGVIFVINGCVLLAVAIRAGRFGDHARSAHFATYAAACCAVGAMVEVVTVFAA